MKYLSVEPSSGRIFGFMTNHIDEHIPLSGCIECPEFINEKNFYHYFFIDGNFIFAGEQPAQHFKFNLEKKEWEPDFDSAWLDVKQQRDSLLFSSDWTELAGSKDRLGDDMWGKWQEYRQALRDITKQPDPFNIVFPVKPGQEK